MTVAVVLPATAEGFGAVFEAFAAFWARVEAVLPVPPDAAWRAGFETAVVEVAANVVRHAYPPGVGGTCRLRLRLGPGGVEARLSDRGGPAGLPPTGPEGPPADLGDLADLAEGGRGVAMARALLDELAYLRTPSGLNRWTLRKRLPPSPTPAPPS